MKSDKNSIERQDGRLSRLIAAAERGDAAAQFDLAVCYYNGEGVEKDLLTAFSWFKKAAAQGHDGAIEILNRFGVDYRNADY